MPVFIPDFTVVEAVFAGKPELAHQIEGLADKTGIGGMAVFGYQRRQFAGCDMLIGLQENLHHPQALIEAIDFLLFEKFYKLLFFLLMQFTHSAVRSHAPQLTSAHRRSRFSQQFLEEPTEYGAAKILSSTLSRRKSIKDLGLIR